MCRSIVEQITKSENVFELKAREMLEQTERKNKLEAAKKAERHALQLREEQREAQRQRQEEEDAKILRAKVGQIATCICISVKY